MSRSHRRIYDTTDLSTASDEILRSVDRAVLASAFKIRDEMRDVFKKSITQYKYATSDYYKMAEGIMVGKLRNGYVKIHALGHKENTGDWKTRFFVNKTTIRKSPTKGEKGFIKKNEAVDKGIKNGNTILSTYIQNAING